MDGEQNDGPVVGETPDNGVASGYRRVLLKVSGEALMGNQPFGIDPDTVSRMAKDIIGVRQLGIDVCVVVGGGNIFRGIKAEGWGMDRTTGDHMGMLATVINALALQAALEGLGQVTRVQSAIPMVSVCETYIRRRAQRHMEKGRVVIFAAGTGNPFFTTDTAAALRASEMGCDALLKGTQVDGVYTADPKKDPNAVRYDRLTFNQAIEQHLGVMDTAALALAQENSIPILVFSIHTPGAFVQALRGSGRFTVVTE